MFVVAVMKQRDEVNLIGVKIEQRERGYFEYLGNDWRRAVYGRGGSWHDDGRARSNDGLCVAFFVDSLGIVLMLFPPAFQCGDNEFAL